jgi:hypothetical protein
MDKELNKSEKFKNFLVALGWMCVILCIGFEMGFVCSKSFINVQMINNFYNGSIPSTFTFGIDNLTLGKVYNNTIDTNKRVCDYDYYANTMCKTKIFKNATGLYCDGLLVCQN